MGKVPRRYASLWEQAFQELSDDDVTAVEVRLTVHRRERPAEPHPRPVPNSLAAG